MVVIFSIIGFIVVCAATVILTSLYIANPTKGASITRSDDPKSALLVIDVQNDITGNIAVYGDTAEFVERVNHTISLAEEHGMEVLYIKNVYGNNPIITLLSGGRFKKDTDGAEFDSSLYIAGNSVFVKNIGDSFSSMPLNEHLVSRNVDTLYIIGADAAGCIYSTARGGVNRNYNVSIIKDSIITRSDDIMARMLDQYEKDGIAVIDMTKFVELLGSIRGI